VKNEGLLEGFFRQTMIGTPSEAYKGLEGNDEKLAIKQEGLVDVEK